MSNAVAMWVKLAATAPDRYYLVIIGQILATMGNVCLLGLPPSVAAAWFGPDQVSSACAIGVFGNQVIPAYYHLFTLVSVVIWFIMLSLGYLLDTSKISTCLLHSLNLNSL